MNSMSQPPEGTAAIMEASDPRYVRLLLDVAHYQQGGGDPVKAVTQYKDRIQVVHLKDVVSPAPSTDGAPPRPYQWVELGRGTVNLNGVLSALNQIGYHGWGIVELDSVPDKSRTPKDCAAINRDYVQRELHLSL
jgi:inosose dehydratase